MIRYSKGDCVLPVLATGYQPLYDTEYDVKQKFTLQTVHGQLNEQKERVRRIKVVQLLASTGMLRSAQTILDHAIR